MATIQVSEQDCHKKKKKMIGSTKCSELSSTKKKFLVESVEIRIYFGIQLEVLYLLTQKTSEISRTAM